MKICLSEIESVVERVYMGTPVVVNRSQSIKQIITLAKFHTKAVFFNLCFWLDIQLYISHHVQSEL